MFDFSDATQNMEEVRTGDSLGGSIKDSGLFPAEIALAYTHVLDSGSTAFVIDYEFEDGSNFRQTEFIVSKKGVSYYEKNGKKIPLPGFEAISNITTLLMGKELKNFGAADGAKGVVPIYSKDAGKEVNKDVILVPALKGKKVFLGMVKVVKNKQTKQGDDWVNTNEEQTINEINKVFDENKRTLTEQQAKADPAFADKWLKKWEGQERNTYKPVEGAPQSTDAGAAGVADLFNAKAENEEEAKDATASAGESANTGDDGVESLF